MKYNSIFYNQFIDFYFNLKCIVFYFILILCLFSNVEVEFEDLYLVVEKYDVKSVGESMLSDIVMVFDLNSSEVVELGKSENLIDWNFEFLQVGYNEELFI